MKRILAISLWCALLSGMAPATPKPEVVQASPAETTVSAVNEVPAKFRTAYFGERPKAFLVDPQELLGPLDMRERLEFLNYHAGDSAIDLFVYVFDGDQEIPEDVRVEELIGKFFAQGRPAAVVFYFMGAPDRAAFYAGPSLGAAVPAAEQRRALDSSVMQALNQVEPSRQIEAFLVQMSIRLYWMERMLGGAEAVGGTAPLPAKVNKTGEKESRVMAMLRPHLDDARRFAVPAAGVSAMLLVLGVARFWFKRRARYGFPDFEVEPRLGGAHAAGVGGVISFASATLPPASQRDPAPDYLRRA